MKTRTNTNLKFKTKSGINMDFTIGKGATPETLLANILLFAPSESLPDLRKFINEHIDKLEKQQ